MRLLQRWLNSARIAPPPSQTPRRSGRGTPRRSPGVDGEGLAKGELQALSRLGARLVVGSAACVLATRTRTCEIDHSCKIYHCPVPASAWFPSFGSIPGRVGLFPTLLSFLEQLPGVGLAPSSSWCVCVCVCARARVCAQRAGRERGWDPALRHREPQMLKKPRAGRQRSSQILGAGHQNPCKSWEREIFRTSLEAASVADSPSFSPS